MGTEKSWMEIDLGAIYENIAGIVTQGRGKRHYVEYDYEYEYEYERNLI